MKNSNRYFSSDPKRVFFAMDDIVGAIKIVEGWEGYMPVELDQTQVEQMNALNGVSPAEAKAAVSCAMFNCWQNFAKIMETNKWLART